MLTKALLVRLEALPGKEASSQTSSPRHDRS